MDLFGHWKKDRTKRCFCTTVKIILKLFEWHKGAGEGGGDKNKL